MGENAKKMKTVRRVATLGISLGVILMFVGFFVSGFTTFTTFVSLLGGGVILASMVFFGFGLFLCLIEELAEGNKSEPTV